jgi:phage gp29-like protein
MLYDHRGEPIKTAALKAEHGASAHGIRSPYRNSEASSINPRRLGSLLRRADDGDTDAYFTLCQEIEERDSHWDTVLRARKQAVSGAELHVAAATDKRKDNKIADAVRSLIAEPIFEGLAFDCLDGLGKGISFVEIHWDTKGKDNTPWRPTSYQWREQRHFTWDPETLSIPLLKTDANPNGEPLAPYKWAVHTPKLRSGPARRAGLSRSAVVIWLLKSLTVRDLMAFMETYGMPIRIGKYAQGATPLQIDELKTALCNMGTDAAGVMVDTMKVELVARAPGASGEGLYLGTAAYWNGELSKLALGQTMTTENGSSLGQAAVHERKEKMINEADARALAATLNRDVIEPFVRLNFGESVEVPRVFYKLRSPTQQTAFMGNVREFVKLGGVMEQSFVRDEMGWPDPALPEDETPHPQFLSMPKPAAPEAKPDDDDAKPAGDA